MSGVLRRAALGILTTGVLAPPTLAQSRGAPICEITDRAQRLLKIEEELNSGDADLRLATLAYVMERGSPAEKIKAANVAVFGSTDRKMRELALRYGLAQTQLLTVVFDPPQFRGGISTQWLQEQGGRFAFVISDFDVATGRFSTRVARPEERARRGPFTGPGQVVGETVTAITTYDTSREPTSVAVSLRLTADGALRGQLSVSGGYSGGPLAASAAFLGPADDALPNPLT